MDAPFSYSDLEVAKIIKAHIQDILTDHQQTLCQILASYHFHYYKTKHRQLELCIFKNMIFNFPKCLGSMSLHNKQYLCEVITSNVSP